MPDNGPSNAGGYRLTGASREIRPDLPLVSVVTAVFNGKNLLAGCIESILQQDYPNVEHIIIDGGSTDGTVDVLHDYNNRIAYWHSERDKGVYDAWNKALQIARGEWICFLGVDDEFLPGAISAYMELAAQHRDAEYLSSRIKWVHPSGYEQVRGKPWNWRDFLRWMCVAHPGSMHHRELFGRLGGYDLSFGSAADYELLLRARDLLKTAYLPEVTVLMRGGGVSDDFDAFSDATRAKIASGGRNPSLAWVELQIARAKALIRPLRYRFATDRGTK